MKQILNGRRKVKERMMYFLTYFLFVFLFFFIFLFPIWHLFTISKMAKYWGFQRNCLFTDELADIFHLDYRRGNCIVNCRAQSTEALCNCIPFNVPNTGSNADTFTQCTLEHIACLNQYKGKYYEWSIENVYGVIVLVGGS